MRQRKTDAEAQLTLAQRQYAEAFDAAARRHSVDEQVRRLLDGDDAPAPTVTDAEVRAARRSLTVADQALREAEQRFATRRADVVREIVLETALPALRRQAHDTALTLARLLAQCAATAEYLETLRLADMLPDGPFVAQWQPGFVLPNPLELQNPVAHSLREMIAAGVVTAAEVETAAGAPLPVGWDTGRLPPDPAPGSPLAARQRTAGEAARGARRVRAGALADAPRHVDLRSGRPPAVRGVIVALAHHRSTAHGHGALATRRGCRRASGDATGMLAAPRHPPAATAPPGGFESQTATTP